MQSDLGGVEEMENHVVSPNRNIFLLLRNGEDFLLVPC